MDDDERTIELSSIVAIYPELVIDAQNPYTATLELSVTPIQPLRILFKNAADDTLPELPTPPPSPEQEHDNSPTKLQMQQPTQLDVHELSHLPPLSLRITLPEDYPATRPPEVALSVMPLWLSRPALKRLRDDCARLWEELGKDQVVYAYIDHLQQAAETAFGLAGETVVQLSSDLQLALLDFDLKTKRERFEKETFDCGICLQPKKGIHCHRLLLCGDVFCVACLQDFYKSCITEGDVDNVKCLSPSCGQGEDVKTGLNGRPRKRRKQDRTLDPSELLQIPIEPELVQRYVRLKRKKRLEADKNTIYCPRQWCQGAARSEKHSKPTDPMNDVEDEISESEEESENTPSTKKPIDPETLPMSERLSICEDCGFAFCCVCRKGWHGELARCSPRRQQELNEEEAASLAYLKKYSTPCPTCNAPAQKTMGCNHMICFKCQTHFCYLCSAYLMPDNPYSHFNDTKNACYMRLWVLEAGDGEDVPINGFHNPELAEWDEVEIESDSDDDDLPPENFEAFRGDRPFADEDSSDDEEPAPDQRRNMHIDIVNFARPGGQNHQRIELPERPRDAGHPPPPVPDPPRARRRRGRGQPGNRQRAMNNEPTRALRPAPAPHPRRANGGGAQVPAHEDVQNVQHDPPPRQGELLILPLAAPGQGNHPAAAAGGGAPPGPVRAMGLERFLQLARQDQEDEWDSDELDDELDVAYIPEPQQRVRRGRWR
ncbi:uncharacterized protein Z518_00344 [Rhinocladiella mackenziei CBS 650.93]|uniref:RBR-type E3 ubiquitin transferase n=1 Tax=Rhinocladiella mackenziei CBS 650.93 TaxID=1442369 RepID=A0A0D2JIK5_9EURO|nr:uncharacterized protein Z518_00344 [Rhinocladiella mackenziei CBS 650.93]KIX09265.1 hypothetical protein Z518_00344 [Rhinocladiella mackenziei CBS 650.93]